MDIRSRLYEDFLRPSKEDEYELILQTAQKCGYEFHTMRSFEDVLGGGINDGKKYLILRRDIDTADFKILQKMLDLEKKYGARATYYFRWNTLNVSLMKEIAESGGEASYHFEEIATFCYKHHIRTKEKMLEHIEEIRDLFIKQYFEFKERTGMPCETIASHGDYVNTKFQFQNKELIDDRVRKATGVIREAYDLTHMKALSCRVVDHVNYDLFTGQALDAIERGEPVLELLIHPRQWNSPFLINLKEEINRACKGIYMRL